MKNYRPVANLSFIPKIIEKAITNQIHSHLINNDIVDNFQSGLLIKQVTAVKLLSYEYIMILLLLLVEIIVQCLFYLTYLMLLTPLIMHMLCIL